MPQVKFWTQDKISYLRNNLHKGNKYLAKKFNVTETAINIVLKRNNIKKKKTMCEHDFYTQQDLLTLLKNKGVYITRDILISFRKQSFIKANIKNKKNKMGKWSTPDQDGYIRTKWSTPAWAGYIRHKE